MTGVEKVEESCALVDGDIDSSSDAAVAIAGQSGRHGISSKVLVAGGVSLLLAAIASAAFMWSPGGAPRLRPKLGGDTQLWQAPSAEGRSEQSRSAPDARGPAAQYFIAREGLQYGRAWPHEAAARSLAARHPVLKAQCPDILDSPWSLHDAAIDTDGGKHWILRSPAGGAAPKRSLLHVINHNGTGHMSFEPRRLCSGPMLERQLKATSRRRRDSSKKDASSEKKQGAAKHLEVGEQDNAQLSNQVVKRSTQHAIFFLRELTVPCGNKTQITKWETLSAKTEVIDGLAVWLTGRATTAVGTKTYHKLVVDWEVVEGHTHLMPMLQTVIRASDSMPVAWCELGNTSTQETLRRLAAAHSHNVVDQFHWSLGFAGAYRDGEKRPQLETRRLTESCSGSSNMPSHFDVRDKHPACLDTSHVLNQGGCGSCWAFAATQATSARACMVNPDLIGVHGSDNSDRMHFSVQQVLSCYKDRDGCQGGWPESAMQEWKKGASMMRDIDYEAEGSTEWPWHIQNEHCEWGEAPKKWVVDRAYWLDSGEKELMADLFCNGPNTVAFEVMSTFYSFFDNDKEAVFTKSDCAGDNVGGHAVAAVGWGVKDGVKYWELLNSWGQYFGNGGFFRMERGVDACKIESYASSGATVEVAKGYWKYEGKGSCQNGKQVHSVKCLKPDGSPASSDDDCPAIQLGSGDTILENLPCEEAEGCDSGYCNGKGDASGDSVDTCQCSCKAGFTGSRCDECAAGYAEYPACREMCTRAADCNGHGHASGVKWTNEFGAQLDSCACVCDEGYSGIDCADGHGPTTPAPAPGPSCVTVGDVGVGPGKPCVFPFKYNGQTYSSCTEAGHTVLWCGVDGGSNDALQWGECSAACDEQGTEFHCDEELKGDFDEDYRGCQSKTVSGNTCQEWTAQKPHKHTRTPENYPDMGLGDHNYCRNPDGEPTIWCYTTSKTDTWEYCEPVACDETMHDAKGEGYRGCQATTRSGLKCQAWGAQTPHEHSRTAENYPGFGLEGNNYCRNPDGEDTIWCYTTDATLRWEYCDVATCDENLHSTNGVDYRGCQSKTVDGKSCVAWSQSWYTTDNYPGLGLGDHNHCRNPDGEDTIWCFTDPESGDWSLCSPLGAEQGNPVQNLLHLPR